MNYIFTGMKHCGKSTIGRAWSDYINAPFYDTDDIILEDYRKEKGTSVETLRQIYTLHGNKFLKDREFELMHHLNNELLPKSDHNVVSLGGGLPVNIDLIDLLQGLETVIYLKDSYSRLFERVAATGKVPFLNEDNAEEHFYSLCREREGYYILHADIIIDLDNLSLEAAKDKVFKTLSAGVT